MSADWIYSSTELPRDGQQIEFVLDHRSVAMAGAYRHRFVRTRWAEYAIECVRSWRIRAMDCDEAVSGRKPPEFAVAAPPADCQGCLAYSTGGTAHAA